MFRELARKGQELDRKACLSLLQQQRCGVLSVLGDGDYPYGMPMNHYYNAADGKIYFHCGRSGHRLDALARHDKVSYCVMDEGVRPEGQWARRVNSVIVFGKMEIIDDISLVTEITRALSYLFTDDTTYIEREIESAAHKTLLLCLTPEHICGKKVVEE